MREVAELVSTVLGSTGLESTGLGIDQCQYLSYREAFQSILNIDPHHCGLEQLEYLARDRLDVQMTSDDRDDWLNLLLAEIIEPTLGQGTLTFIYNYPVGQAALAKIAVDETGIEVAQRFELYIQGIELANGYHELTDRDEQSRRFQTDQQARKSLGYQQRESDTRLLDALKHGLPACSGVALGIDRLVMLAMGSRSIEDVLAFPIERA